MSKQEHSSIKIVHLALNNAAIVTTLYLLINNLRNESSVGNSLAIMEGIFSVISLALGFIYLVEGFRKPAAKFYKAFMFAFLVTTLVNIISVIITKQVILRAILEVVSIVCITILAVGKDLGKNKTYIVASILLVCKFVCFISTLLSKNILSDFFNTLLNSSITNLLLGVTALIMVVEKYINKNERCKN